MRRTPMRIALLAAGLNVRGPYERDDASTSKLAVQFPAGFASAS
jgi:hypothetical protein